MTLFDRRNRRPLLAAAATPALSLVFVGLLTSAGGSYRVNAGLALLAFSLAGAAGGWIARRHAALVVALGMGLTWGTIALFVLADAVQSKGQIRSAILALVAIALSVLVAAVTQRYLNVRTLRRDEAERSTGND
jgi:hypothetical protein